MGTINRKPVAASGAAFLSGTDADRPATSPNGTHYLAVDSGKLWRWAGAWVLVGTLQMTGGGGTTPPTPVVTETSTTSLIYDRNTTVDWWRFKFTGTPKPGTPGSMDAANGTHALTYRDISSSGYSSLLADEWGISGGYVFVGITYTNPTTGVQSVTVQVTA